MMLALPVFVVGSGTNSTGPDNGNSGVAHRKDISLLRFSILLPKGANMKSRLLLLTLCATFLAAFSLSCSKQSTNSPSNPETSALEVVSPNGGENWGIGKSYSIRWTSNNITGDVRIRYSMDGGNNWPIVIGDSVVNTGSYEWTTVEPRTNAGRVKIESLEDPTVEDMSDANFIVIHAWEPENSGTQSLIYGLACTDMNHCWAFGESNTILHTTDGGENWSAQTSPANTYYASGTFTDVNTGWAVGGNGVIVHTTNGGATWTRQTSDTTASLYSVAFTDNRHGWAVGDHALILYTTNGGNSWSPQSSGLPSSYIIRSVTAVDSLYAWCTSSNETVLSTTNGGIIWNSVSAHNSDVIVSIVFVDYTHGWILGALEGIYGSVDGGTTWSPQAGNGQNFTDLGGMNFINVNNGWTAGQGGRIRHTTNGGQTWHDQSSRVSIFSFAAVAFADSLHGWVAGSNGTILHTTIGGE
jgi:photosystem II stability/assembly factor-like uncharacterized protein